MQLGEFLDHSGAVGAVRDTKPLGISVKHFYSGFLAVDKSVDAEGDEQFGLWGVDVAVEEFFEFTLAVVEVIGSEAPQIH